MTSNATRYIVVPAPGYYGDSATVMSSHATVSAARKAAGRGRCVREGNMAKGDRWLRVYEESHPIV